MSVPTPGPARSGRSPACLALLAILAAFPQMVRAAGPDPQAGSGVVATGSAPLQASIVVETLETRKRPDGTVEKRFVEAQSLKAGEQVYYTIRVTNPGKVPVEDVVVTKRMPMGVDYIRGSAVGPACDVEFSIDGGNTFTASPKGSEYTHMRWTCEHPLSPGATALLRFRAIFR